MSTPLALTEALANYFRAAVTVLRHSTKVTQMWRSRWVKADDPNLFHEIPDAPRPNWLMAVRHEKETLGALPEYAACVEAVAADPGIAPALGKLAGTFMASRKITPDEIVEQALNMAIHRSETLDEVEGRAAELAHDVVEDVSLAPATITTIVPLVGVSAPPIRLNEDTEISELTDDEIERLLRAGMLRMLGGGGMVRLPSRCCLRIKTKVGRIASDKASYHARIKQEERAIGAGRGGATWLAKALRLEKPGRVHVGGQITFGESIIGGGASTATSSWELCPSSIEYTLNETEVRSVIDTMRALVDERVTKHEFIDVALRRLLFAGDRKKREDRFLDLMIGTEALFLPEKGTEISYKFSIRVAHFVQIGGNSRRTLYKSMRDAYDLRSKIVHGGEVAGAENELIDLVEEVLRSGAREMIRRALANPDAKKGKLVDWDELVLGQ